MFSTDSLAKLQSADSRVAWGEAHRIYEKHGYSELSVRALFEVMCVGATTTTTPGVDDTELWEIMYDGLEAIIARIVEGPIGMIEITPEQAMTLMRSVVGPEMGRN